MPASGELEQRDWALLPFGAGAGRQRAAVEVASFDLIKVMASPWLRRRIPIFSAV